MMDLTVRTSLSHPLRIAALPVGRCGGAIGVTFAPGKRQAVAMTGVWERDLGLDLGAIRDWGAGSLISLLEPHEFAELGIRELPERAEALGLHWHGLPIADGYAPDDRFLQPWNTLESKVASGLIDGDRIVVHCKGGLGRAGTVACLLLLATGAAGDAEQAIRQVRIVRPGAIETIEQEAFLHRWARDRQ